MFMDRKIQYNCNQNPSKLFCGYSQTDSEVSMVKQKIQNSQQNIEEEQSQDWFQDLL